jgi:hypothetical protein
MTFAKAAGIAAMFVLAACASAPQADDDWELLGERTVNHSMDHDEIVVGKKEGDFERIALRVKGAAVEFHRVTVHFRNGDDEVIEMRDEIEAGGQTRAIDLPGDDRIIQSVSFNYHTDERGDRAVVQLLGMS